MTLPDYISEHGAEFRKFAKKEAFAELLRMIDDESPARKLTALSETDKLNGSVVFLNKIAGWEELRQLIAGLARGEKPEAETPADKYAESEV